MRSVPLFIVDKAHPIALSSPSLGLADDLAGRPEHQVDIIPNKVRGYSPTHGTQPPADGHLEDRPTRLLETLSGGGREHSPDGNSP